MYQFRAAPLLVLALTFSACTKDTTPLDEVTVNTIGTSGGTALSADGRLTLTVPAGTLAGDVRITIRTDRRNAAGLASPRFDLSSDPPVTRFDPAVAIQIRADGNGRPLGLANVDAAPVLVTGSTHDVAAGVVRGQLEHFSGYAAIFTDIATQGCPASAPIGAGACGSQALSCSYGQECCCGQCYDSLRCSCDGNGGDWACAYTDACLGAAITCPDAGPMDTGTSTITCPSTWEAANGQSCGAAAVTCEYGQECCCGSCGPAVVCSCTLAGFACHYTDRCLGPCEPIDAGILDVGTSTGACPVSWEAANGQSCGPDGVSCQYGEECCCGSCGPSVVCSCSGGQFGCHYTDRCLGPCPADAG